MLSLKKNYKIYFYIKSFYFYYLQRDLKSLFNYLKKNNLFFLKKNLIYLPILIKKFSVVKSPFVSKLSKEQFEIRVHKLIIIFFFSNELLLEFLKKSKILYIDLKYSYIKIVYYFYIKINRDIL